MVIVKNYHVHNQVSALEYYARTILNRNCPEAVKMRLHFGKNRSWITINNYHKRSYGFAYGSITCFSKAEAHSINGRASI